MMGPLAFLGLLAVALIAVLYGGEWLAELLEG